MKMIEPFLKLFGFPRSESKCVTEEQDALLQLIDTRLSFGTDSFLQDIIFLALHAPNPTSVIRRIMVKCLTQVKHPHEGVIAELIDTDHPDAEPLVIFLGRTASYNRPNPNYFSSHPNSDTVLESIVHTLKEMPSSTLASLTTSGSNDSSSSLISLFDFTPPLYCPIIDEAESDHEPECNASIRLPWFDDVTLAGAKVLHVSTQSTRTSHRAEDRFVGSQIVKAYVPSLQNLRTIKLKSNSLSLFDLAVLADSVHDHDPLYSVLKHRCYWFAEIVCAVVEKVYPCTTIHSKKYTPVSEDMICIPANDYLPDLAGRTMGMLVCKVEEAVVSVVASNFRTYKEAKRTEVHFIINSEGHSLKYGSRYRQNGKTTIREQTHCTQEYPAWKASSGLIIWIPMPVSST